jgi:putative transcriptional regulator
MLLVAAPTLLDPNFFHTVIFLCRHGEDEGTVGLVLNRCTDLTVEQALGDLSAADGREEPLWVGGPVDTRSLWLLHRRPDLASPGFQVQDGLFFTPDPDIWNSILKTNGPDTKGSTFRLFVGYAGWEAGQLEQEIAEGSWVVVAAGPECVFSEAPELLWQEMTIRSLLPCTQRPELIFNARFN